jgi:6-phosphogluconolactonase
MGRLAGFDLRALAFAGACLVGAHGAAPAATMVYVGNADSDEITVMQLQPQNGALTLVETAAIPGLAKSGTNSSPIAVAPDKRALYVAVRSEPFVAARFAIDPASGKLAHRGNSPLADSMAYIVTDRSGRYLLSASYPGHKLTVNAIAADGALEPAKQVIPTAPNAHSIVPDAANRFVLATSLGGDIIYQYRFDAATGALSPNEPATVKVKEKAGPRHLLFHPNGKLVYLTCEVDGSVYVFDYDAGKGTLAQKQVLSALPDGYSGKIWVADLHATPNGKFLYVSERATNTLAAFKIDPESGTLTPIGHFPTEQQPRGFNIDPSGKYLLAVGQLSNSLTSYAIDPETGTLTRLAQYPMGKNPNWIELVELN